MKYQPRTKGVKRNQKSTYIHKEVIRNLKQIARDENKSFSWVVAEIVYSFFGLKIEAPPKERIRVIKFRRRA